MSIEGKLLEYNLENNQCFTIEELPVDMIDILLAEGVFTEEDLDEYNKRVNDPFTPHGVYGVSNTMAYEVELSHDGDGARLRDSGGTVSDWAEIEFTYNEEVDYFEPYIPLWGGIFLSEVLRV